MKIGLSVVILLYWSLATVTSSELCNFKDIFNINTCDSFDPDSELIERCKEIKIKNHKSPPIFIFYDVNYGEGFNLRRDVYIRMAVFIKNINKKLRYRNVYLVLPPFYQLYHWMIVEEPTHHTNEIKFWSQFFDISSLRRYTQVFDLPEYFRLMKICFNHNDNEKYTLNHVFELKYFESMFSSGKFEEKYNVKARCDRNEQPNFGLQFTKLYSNFLMKHFHCTEFQGSAMLLTKLLYEYTTKQIDQPQAIVILNAETVLHEHWGDAEFWSARRSMRFIKNLIEIAKEFRIVMFNSTDKLDNTIIPADWKHEKPHRNAVGGNYLCAHLRRGDFIQGREKTTPSIRAAATQISNYAKNNSLTNVFISSDCTGTEFHALKSALPRLKVKKFKTATLEQKKKLGPGAIAIIDQIICSHARFFIGTYESTFTYRIYEEREIIGFPENSTFNTFCKTHYETVDCAKNTIWPIIF